MAAVVKETCVELTVDTANSDPTLKKMPVLVWLDEQGNPGNVAIGTYRLTAVSLRELADKVDSLRLIDIRA